MLHDIKCIVQMQVPKKMYQKISPIVQSAENPQLRAPKVPSLIIPTGAWFQEQWICLRSIEL
jgi:hypothetical protein